LNAFSSELSELLPSAKGIDVDGKMAFTSRMFEVGGADTALSAALLPEKVGLFPNKAVRPAL